MFSKFKTILMLNTISKIEHLNIKNTYLLLVL